jgi:small-conductance mechanosensitive channel
MREFFNAPWFTFGNMAFSYGQILSTIGIALLFLVVYRYIVWQYLPKYFARNKDSQGQIKKVNRIIAFLFYLSLIITIILILSLDYTIFSNDNITFRISTLLEAILILQFARLLDWIISRVFIHSFYARRDNIKAQDIERKQQTEESANKTVQFIVYVLAIILILTNFRIDITLIEFTTKEGQPFTLKLSNIFIAVLVILVARLSIWVITQLFLYSYYKLQKINPGAQYAYNQLVKYVIYVLAVVIAIQYLGVQTTLIWGGLAALLVGIGLGLQQTFNDFFSGIILLFERSVELGDVLEVDGLVGTVRKIGMRASIVETRENMTVIVPNSKLVTQNVINWSHFDDKVRFSITVGVAYGSDTELVKNVLIRAANSSSYVLENPIPFVRFTNFGDSSLTFELHFWSRNFINIEDIKSNLRYEIDMAFRKNNIHIPFPQLDLWMQTHQSK